ncbi:conserved hypothetical protein [Frankia sp. Hr75.2]|nr:conserved hypothetical protein [Frankia sp. Hr75.2]
MRLSPRQRGQVRIELARRIGLGEIVTRHDVIAELFGRPAATTPGFTVTVLAGPDRAPDAVATAPDVAPDVVSYADVAAALGVTLGTVRAYCAPSRGKLVRLRDGVSRASLDRLTASRAA